MGDVRPAPALAIESLEVRFGGVRAVDDVTLDVQPGELLGLIGPNGAGKTTTIDAVTGFVPSGGLVHLDGRPLHGMPPHRRAQAGLVRTWQSLELFDDLTVRESCAVGLDRGGLLGGLRAAVAPGRREALDRAQEALEVLGLAALGDRSPAELPLGQRKLVAVARALAGRPRVLLLDEPAAGLDSDESLALGERLRSLIGPERSMVLVDHDMGLVLGTCDRVAVLEHGRIIAVGTPAAIRSDPRVVEAYLGERHAGADGAAAGGVGT